MSGDKPNKKAFFSFIDEDRFRATVVKDRWKSEENKTANFEELVKQGDTAIENWVDEQLEGASLKVVLVGKETRSSKWVKYATEKNIENGNGLLGNTVSKIKDLQVN